MDASTFDTGNTSRDSFPLFRVILPSFSGDNVFIESSTEYKDQRQEREQQHLDNFHLSSGGRL